MPVICEPTRLKMKSSSRKKFKWYANICLNFFVCFSTSNMRFVSLGLLCACVCVSRGEGWENAMGAFVFIFISSEISLVYPIFGSLRLLFGILFFQCLLCVNITDIPNCGWMENIWLHFSHQIFNWISLQSSANRMEWHLNIDSRTKCRIMNV